MTSGDALKKLFRSYTQLDQEGFYIAALDLINQEKQKKHNVLARDLLKILENGNNKSVSSTHVFDLQKVPKDKDRGTLLFDIRSSDQYLSDIVLSAELKSQVEEIIREFVSSELLKTFGLSPRKKILFAGPPGCGKTLCANVLAAELGLPLLYARFDSVISSYLGETSANLRRIFDFASSGTWVVFFDEFDAIGKSRDDLSEHGELKRVVNTFLQLLDNFNSDSIFIAATNHESNLDNALWRRFDEILFFDKPDEEQVRSLVKLKLSGISHRKLSVDKFSNMMLGLSHADIERVCMDAVKISILSGESALTDSLFEQALKKQTRRMRLIKKNQKK